MLTFGGLLLMLSGLDTYVQAEKGEREAEADFTKLEQPQPAHKPPTVRRGQPLALLTIDDRKLYVLEGAGKTELSRGPGHLSGTALPGDAGNCIIAGHRDTHFRILSKVELGDTISLESGGRRFEYRVTDRFVVKPSDTSTLAPTTNSSLTLVTCYPFYYVGPAPKRFIVRAELVR